MVSSLALFSDVVLLFVIIMVGYAAYWAFSVRRGQAVSLYRRQALGVGLVAIADAMMFAYIGTFFALLARPGPGQDPIFPLITSVFQVTLFYWIDATVLAARRSDPLLRDTLHWRQLRKLLWVLVIIFASYQPIVVPAKLSSVPLLASLGWIGAGLASTISGIVALTLSILRSKDPTLRRTIKWFGLFIASSASPFVNLFLGPPESLILISVSSLVGGYFLYRSARSLVPLNRLTLETYAK